MATSNVQAKVYERVLNMAQMHQIGVLHRGPNMLWTCRWTENGRQSSICYELLQNPADRSLSLRLRYRLLGDQHAKRAPLDYTVPIRTSRSYKRKTWYWFVCPLVINGQACKRRVRNLYFLPNSAYFGCKHCRDMMIRSLPLEKRMQFIQTESVTAEEARKRQKQRPRGAAAPELNMGWRPSVERQVCHRCGCLSEGAFCCHCGITLEESGQENFFEVLGIVPDASEQELRIAFTTRLKEYHPDRVAHLGKKLRDVAEREIKQINLAYETLRDPDRRESYLRKIGQPV